ncbi:MAG TPA: AtaL-like protein [Geothrix sp.]|nr:AtaL-like protein [Geothrix sp.]
MPKHRISCRVDASPDTVWAVLLDKMEHPQRYLEDALDAEILVRGRESVIRQLVLPRGVSFRERISPDAGARTITFTLLDHPVYEGTVVNRLVETPEGVELAFELDWKPRPGCEEEEDPEEPRGLIDSSLTHTKRIAEALEMGILGALET